MRQQKHRSGFSLIEAAIVLGIVGLVIGGIWVAAAAVQSSLRLSRTYEDTLRIVSGLRELYRGQPAPSTGSLLTVVKATKLVPETWLSADGTSLQSPWGGIADVGYGAATYNYTCSGSVNSWVVEFLNVPTSACIQMLQRMQIVYPKEVLSATVNGACSAPATMTYMCGDSGDSNSMAFVFKR